MAWGDSEHGRVVVPLLFLPLIARVTARPPAVCPPRPPIRPPSAQSARYFRLHMARSPSKSRSRASFFTRLLGALREAQATVLSSSPPQSPMSPTLAPQASSGPIGTLRPSSVPFTSSSASSSRTLPDNASVSTSPAYSSSSLSIPFEDGDTDVARVEGLRHASYKLEARSVSLLIPGVALQGPPAD